MAEVTTKLSWQRDPATGMYRASHGRHNFLIVRDGREFALHVGETERGALPLKPAYRGLLITCREQAEYILQQDLDKVADQLLDSVNRCRSCGATDVEVIEVGGKDVCTKCI